MALDLSLVLATPPEAGDLARVVALVRAARARGQQVALFVMHDGVRALAADPAALAALHELDCELIGCATSADRHGVDLAGLGVTVGSQDDHAALVARAGRLVAFT